MIYLLLWSHWLADFVLQTDEMAKNKSKRIEALLSHVFTYSAALCPFALMAGWTVPGWRWMTFVTVNGATHFCIDFVTSRISSHMWQKQRVHDFFVVIGFDQFLHVAILLYTHERWLA